MRYSTNFLNNFLNMIKLSLKDFFDEIKKRNIEITNNDEPVFNRFS